MTVKTVTTKPWKDLTIADDYMFKAVMKHPRICKRLIEKILDIKIVADTHPCPQTATLG